MPHKCALCQLARGQAGRAKDLRRECSGGRLIKNGDVYGDVVNTASRVEHHSEPDQIFISEDLAETAGALGVNVTSMGAAELKGKAETVQLYKLDWSGYVPKAPQPESANKKSKLFGILAAGAVLAVLAVGTSVWLMRPEPAAVEYALFFGYNRSNSKAQETRTIPRACPRIVS